MLQIKELSHSPAEGGIPYSRNPYRRAVDLGGLNDVRSAMSRAEGRIFESSKTDTRVINLISNERAHVERKPGNPRSNVRCGSDFNILLCSHKLEDEKRN